jgi:hypothetical protein
MPEDLAEAGVIARRGRIEANALMLGTLEAEQSVACP